MYCRQGKERAFFIGGGEKGRGNDTLATRAEMAARACHRRRSNAEFFASSWRKRDRDMGREREIKGKRSVGFERTIFMIHKKEFIVNFCRGN